VERFLEQKVFGCSSFVTRGILPSPPFPAPQVMSRLSLPRRSSVGARFSSLSLFSLFLLNNTNDCLSPFLRPYCSPLSPLSRFPPRLAQSPTPFFNPMHPVKDDAASKPPPPPHNPHPLPRPAGSSSEVSFFPSHNLHPHQPEESRPCRPLHTPPPLPSLAHCSSRTCQPIYSLPFQLRVASLERKSLLPFSFRAGTTGASSDHPSCLTQQRTVKLPPSPVLFFPRWATPNPQLFPPQPRHPPATNCILQHQPHTITSQRPPPCSLPCTQGMKVLSFSLFSFREGQMVGVLSLFPSYG